jgi:tetratricopeptide (TPR) repeat protein
MEYYGEMMHHYDDSHRDSIDTAKKLYTLYYQYGRYYDAIDGYRRLTEIDSSLPVYWQVIGNLNMFVGEYEAAWQAYDSAFSLDTTYASAPLMQAEILARRGDTAGAIKRAEKYYSIEQTIPAKIEFLLLLGRLYEADGPHNDTTKARRSFEDALTWANEMIAKVPDDPAFVLRAGLAHFGLKEYTEARNLLEIAYFTETRDFYLGQILAELGRVNDILGNREDAIRYYQEGLAVQSPVYYREICRRYLDEPYRD